MSSEVKLQVLRTTAELEALRTEWIRLWETDPRARPFQRPEWLLPWWRQFGQPDLRAVLFREDGRLVGLLPLYVYSHEGTGERLLLLVGAGTSDYLDGVFGPECGVDEIVRAMELLRSEGGWEVGHLTQLAAGSLVLAAMERMATGAGGAAVRRYAGESCSRCRALPMRELPGKVRRQVMYSRNFAISRGRLLLTVADAGTWEEMFAELVRTHTERWERAGERGVLAEAAVLAWHRETIPELLASGLLRLCALRLDGRIVAVLYSLLDPEGRAGGGSGNAEDAGRTQYFYLMGYALEEEELQPGTLLLAFASEGAAAEGVRTIDMLRGEEAYKRFWHAEPAPTWGFEVRREGTG